MTDALLIAVVVMLVLIWVRLATIATVIQNTGSHVGPAISELGKRPADMQVAQTLSRMDERLADIQERMQTHFETDAERQHEIDMEP